MRPALEQTSLPAWTTAVTCPGADVSGRSWTVVAFGPDDPVAAIVERWTAEIATHRAGAQPRVHRVGDDGTARAAVAADLAGALVGWRLMMAGPADACLRLRAFALDHGVGDDEITVASTAVSTRDIRCVHCAAVTRADIALEEVLPCRGCGRNLLVYYHVSRRLGAHLGFQVDAERDAALSVP
ncbi:MAG: hypothetical protein JST91_27055 [Actinobacteria bacterium]|nr:hypothetical protein [Actinomycetota bacterium]